MLLAAIHNGDDCDDCIDGEPIFLLVAKAVKYECGDCWKAQTRTMGHGVWCCRRDDPNDAKTIQTTAVRVVLVAATREAMDADVR